MILFCMNSNAALPPDITVTGDVTWILEHSCPYPGYYNETPMKWMFRAIIKNNSNQPLRLWIIHSVIQRRAAPDIVDQKYLTISPHDYFEDSYLTIPALVVSCDEKSKGVYEFKEGSGGFSYKITRQIYS